MPLVLVVAALTVDTVDTVAPATRLMQRTATVAMLRVVAPAVIRQPLIVLRLPPVMGYSTDIAPRVMPILVMAQAGILRATAAAVIRLAATDRADTPVATAAAGIRAATAPAVTHPVMAAAGIRAVTAPAVTHPVMAVAGIRAVTVPVDTLPVTAAADRLATAPADTQAATAAVVTALAQPAVAITQLPW